MSDLTALLDVQVHDTAIDQLRHRSATLPARASLASIEASLAALEARAAEVNDVRRVVERRQKAAEDEASSLADKIHDLDRKLYGGTVSAIKELQSLQADIDSLQRRKSDVEDTALEAMEELEPFDAELASIDAERTRLDGEGAALRAHLAESEVEIDAEIAKEQAARDEVAPQVPPAILDEYERLRTKLGGVAAAPLESGGRCGGCHLTLPAAEWARIKREVPRDALIHCEQCGRILVRTDAG